MNRGRNRKREKEKNTNQPLERSNKFFNFFPTISLFGGDKFLMEMPDLDGSRRLREK